MVTLRVKHDGINDPIINCAFAEQGQKQTLSPAVKYPLVCFRYSSWHFPLPRVYIIKDLNGPGLILRDHQIT